MDYAEEIASKLIPQLGAKTLTEKQIAELLATAARQGYRLASGYNSPSARVSW